MVAGVRRPAGFTLIELMITVAIVGILASVAVPAYSRLTMRSRTAERELVMTSIKRGVSALFLRDGKVSEFGPWNPATMPGTSRLAFEHRLAPDGWSKLGEIVQIDGATYYQYMFLAVEAGGAVPTLDIWAYGDLDGDTLPSRLMRHYERRNGQYWTDELDTTDTWCVSEPGMQCVPDTATF